jgi:hypothetical protein
MKNTEFSIEKVIKNWFKVMDKTNSKNWYYKQQINYISDSYNFAKHYHTIKYKHKEVTINFVDKCAFGDSEFKYPYQYLIIYSNIMDYDLLLVTEQQVKDICTLLDIDFTTFETIINDLYSDIISLQV